MKRLVSSLSFISEEMEESAAPFCSREMVGSAMKRAKSGLSFASFCTCGRHNTRSGKNAVSLNFHLTTVLAVHVASKWMAARRARRRFECRHETGALGLNHPNDKTPLTSLNSFCAVGSALAFDAAENSAEAYRPGVPCTLIGGCADATRQRQHSRDTGLGVLLRC